MRGRTFLNRYIILDEAQNLTPKQMKALVTRAGPGTKLVCLGNIAQIDTPYLTETTSGLTYVVNRFRGWPHSGTSRCCAASARASPTSPPRPCDWRNPPRRLRSKTHAPPVLTAVCGLPAHAWPGATMARDSTEMPAICRTSARQPTRC